MSLKIQAVVDILKAGKMPVVRFTDKIEECEMVFDEGALARITSFETHEDGSIRLFFNFSEFEKQVRAKCKPAYYNPEGNPRLCAYETRFWPENLMEDWHFGANEEAPFVVEPETRAIVRVKRVRPSANPLPQYMTAHASCMDLYADLPAPVVIKPGRRQLIPSGLAISLPEGIEVQLRPRSGLALKHGIMVHPGTIDGDYRGEMGILLFNMGEHDFEVKPGDRIAQMFVGQYIRAELEEVEELDETERGVGGFGHTGV